MDLVRLFQKCLYAPYTTVSHSADFYTERLEGVLYVYFQCSNGTEDWMNNLDFPVKALTTGEGEIYYAHRGFVRVWQAVLPRIAELSAERSVRSIVTVGYSHGAALALLSHGYFWETYPRLREHLAGYGFGCPRVFWGKILHPQVWERFTVIRNQNDAVTHLPPAILGYRHVGKLLSVGEKGKYSPVDAHRPENILRELNAMPEKREIFSTR